MAQASIVALRLYGVAAVESGQATSLVEGTSLVHYRALAAIVEPAHYSVPAPTDEDTERYMYILEQAFANATVLPAPTGTVFQSQNTLMRWLELHYFTLTEALAVVEGHSAARVSITTRPGQQDGETGRSFAALAAESLRMLRSQAAATVTLPKADEDDEDGVVARASFLVDSQRWQTFKETVNKEAQRQPALAFNVTGPWPPYDFVRMQFGG
ncbi:MAG TPA: GvpL/GvpF family gas vesicle protein [Gemmatimonadaceae bacterium]